jgi:hypothetical protein
MFMGFMGGFLDCGVEIRVWTLGAKPQHLMACMPVSSRPSISVRI